MRVTSRDRSEGATTRLPVGLLRVLEQLYFGFFELEYSETLKK